MFLDGMNNIHDLFIQSRIFYFLRFQIFGSIELIVALLNHSDKDATNRCVEKKVAARAKNVVLIHVVDKNRNRKRERERGELKERERGIYWIVTVTSGPVEVG